MSIKATNMATKSGSSGLITRWIVVWATPTPIKSTEPTGGVQTPIQRFITIIIPKCTGCRPNFVTTGRKMGVKISTAGVMSINVPTMSNTRFIINKMTNLFSGINILIWIVGVGTLLAGVIGVSNIMLIVVKERTQEIGIQRAIGAPPVQIITQIIVESVFLTAIAGYFGLAIGVGLLELVNFGLQSSGAESNMFMNPSVDFTKAMWALTILVISGIFAGLIPASRAISIKPIDALRDEV